MGLERDVIPEAAGYSSTSASPVTSADDDIAVLVLVDREMEMSVGSCVYGRSSCD